MESFYGGRPGASFVIVKTFETIDAMKKAFIKGTSYNEVYFDEYVTIYNTTEQGYKYNGNVYRRGYNLNNGLGGAEYVGNITGPAGPATTIEFFPYNQINHSTEGFTDKHIYGNVETEKPSIIDEYIAPYQGQDAIDLIPGAQMNEQGNYTNFNDNIFYRYCSVLDTQNKINVLKIGFKMPYPIFNFSVTSIDADQPIEINKVDNGTHKFFHNWNLKIPTSVKGDSVSRLCVVTVNSSQDNDYINYEFYAPGVPSEQQAKRASDVENKQAILVCDIVKYDSKGNAKAPETYYVSDFNVIKNINITPQGYLVFTLPDGSEVNSENSILPTIDNIGINDYGQISINWSNTDNTSGTSTFENEIKWVHSIDYSDDGGLMITWNTPKRAENGTIEYESDGITPIRDSQLLPMTNGQKLITDLQIHNNMIYETYLGLKKEMCDLFDENQVNNAANTGATSIYNDTVNNPDGTLYWWNGDNLTWYKKLFDLNNVVKTLVEEKINATFPDIVKYYNKGTTIDNITVNTTLKFVFSSNVPWAYDVCMDIDLPESIPSDVQIIQSAKTMRAEAKKAIFSHNVIRKIYLQEISKEQLRYIYWQFWDQSKWGDDTTYTSNPTAMALKVWQNIGYDLFDENNPCLDPWAHKTSEIETWNTEKFGTQTHYDYRFYTGQKFYYSFKVGGPAQHASYDRNSMTACKNIFGVSPLRNLDVFSGKTISSLGSEYFDIYDKDVLATHLASYPKQSQMLTQGTHHPSFWLAEDSYEVKNNVIQKITTAIPGFAFHLFTEILTGIDFQLPDDTTKVGTNMQAAIDKVTQWNISQKNGKLYCYGPARGGSNYSGLAGRTISVPVTVELANLNF